MGDLLIVASETSQPLSTDVPLPTDGQPEWWRCPHCGDRERIEGLRPGESPGLHVCDVAEMVPDGTCTCDEPSGVEHYCKTLNRLRRPVGAGPFPFAVARWTEVVTCPGCEQDLEAGGGWPSPEEHERCDRALRKVGAAVELVEVTGPSHHADECRTRLGYFYCHPDALPNGWHTPTGKVTPIDPIPCDRPWVAGDRSQATCSQCGQGWRAAACGPTHALLATEARYAAVWVADADLTARIREAPHA